jgi:hypothetical protein
LTKVVLAALEEDLGWSTYDCTRSWEAWQVGTMDQDDFRPVSERLDTIADSIVAAIASAPDPRIAVLEKALRLAAIKLDAMANPDFPCPDPETCCDPGFIVDDLIKQAREALKQTKEPS